MTEPLKPVGDGTYTGIACAHCGSQVFVFAGETPDCLPCFMAREKAVMGAESVGGGLTQLLGVVRDLTPEAKKTLLSDALAFRVMLEQVIWGCQR